MREHRQESECVLSYQRTLILKWGCTKDLSCHLFLQLWLMSLNLPEGALSEWLYADDLALTSETIGGLRKKFLKQKEAFESKGMSHVLGKTKVMVSGGITKDGLSKSKADPHWVFRFRVKANSVLCVQCGKWIHCTCARVQRVTQKFSRNFTCRKCEGNIEEAVEQKERLCDEVETVRELAYHSNRVSAGEAAVTARTRCGFKVECWRKSDYCLAELNLATLTCGYYQILHIGVSLFSNIRFLLVDAK